MTKFRNISEDARDIPALGITVEAGGTTPELSRDEARGFALQTDVWAAVEAAPKRAPQKADKAKEND